MVIVNFKASDELKEAIRQAAFLQKISPSRFVREMVQANPLVIKQFRKLKKKVS